MSINEAFGKRIELIKQVLKQRTNRNLSQKEIAEILKTGQQSISMIEKGLRCPSLDTFIKYADSVDLEVVLRSK